MSGRYLSLRVVAECYQVELSWLREVYDYGLLGEGRREADETAIAAEMLERLATIRRLAVQQGVNLPGIAIILDLLEA